MTNLETNPEINKLLEIEDLANLHQSVFENIYNLAFKQKRGWSDFQGIEPNPKLFIQAERILQPLYLAWREKYALIRQAIMGGEVSYCDVIKSFVWENKTDERTEQYYISHGEEIDDPIISYSLQIRKPGVCLKSQPSTAVLWRQKENHWEEAFDFYTFYSDNYHARKIRLKITESAGNNKSDPNDFLIARDWFSLHFDEEIQPLIAPKSYLGTSPVLQRHVDFCVWRPSLSDTPHPRRLVENLTGTISNLGYKIQRKLSY